MLEPIFYMFDAVVWVFTALLLFTRRKIYDISVLKTIILLIFGRIVGIIGAVVAGRIIYGGGIRFYGSVLAVIIAFIPIAKILKIPYYKMMAFCSAPVMIGIVIMKVLCLVNGCCSGFTMFCMSDGRIVFFPSQIVELLFALALVIWLIYLERKEINRPYLFSNCLIWYAIPRYVADWCRDDGTGIPFLIWIPAGRFFSIFIFLVGVVTLFLQLEKNISRKPSIKETICAMIGRLPMDTNLKFF